jgi:hypothetical protein
VHIHFIKNRDDESYYVIAVLVDIKAYIESRIQHTRTADDSGLEKTAEDIIFQAFDKKKFARSHKYILLEEGNNGKNNVLERISSAIEILEDIKSCVSTLKLDESIQEEKILKSVIPKKIRKLKEEIDALDIQVHATVENWASA